MDRAWIPPLGLALVSLAIAGYFWIVSPLVSHIFTVVAAGFIGAAVWAGFKSLRRDKYDLKELERVHLKLEVGGIQTGDVSSEAETITCLCGNVYDSRIPACPNCKRAL